MMNDILVSDAKRVNKDTPLIPLLEYCLNKRPDYGIITERALAWLRHFGCTEETTCLSVLEQIDSEEGYAQALQIKKEALAVIALNFFIEDELKAAMQASSVFVKSVVSLERRNNLENTIDVFLSEWMRFEDNPENLDYKGVNMGVAINVSMSSILAEKINREII